MKHGDDDDMTREPEMVKAYRDTWELGLHSYLTYLRDRLLVARELLTPSGSDLRPDQRRERPPRAGDAGRGIRRRELLSLRSCSRRRRANQRAPAPAVTDYLLWYAQGPGPAEVPSSSILAKRELERGRRPVHAGWSS